MRQLDFQKEIYQLIAKVLQSNQLVYEHVNANPFIKEALSDQSTMQKGLVELFKVAPTAQWFYEELQKLKFFFT